MLQILLEVCSTPNMQQLYCLTVISRFKEIYVLFEICLETFLLSIGTPIELATKKNRRIRLEERSRLTFSVKNSKYKPCQALSKSQGYLEPFQTDMTELFRGNS